MARNSLMLVTLVVDCYDRAKAFYCNGLGFDCLEDSDLGEGKRWVVVRPPGESGASLLLAKADGEEEVATIGHQTGGRVAFFLQTDDFDRDYQVFVSAGVTFLETPRREPYGTVVVFEDLYGNRWDLLQPA